MPLGLKEWVGVGGPAFFVGVNKKVPGGLAVDGGNLFFLSLFLFLAEGGGGRIALEPGDRKLWGLISN